MNRREVLGTTRSSGRAMNTHGWKRVVLGTFLLLLVQAGRKRKV